MRRRIKSRTRGALEILGLGPAVLWAGCNIVAGLQPAYLIQADGGGGATTTSSSSTGSGGSGGGAPCVAGSGSGCHGALVWAKRFGDAGGQHASAVAVDASGDVIVAGKFGGTINFGGSDLIATAPAIFLVKLDPNGNHLWSKRFGAGLDTVGGLAVDAAGDIVLVGAFSGSVDFGGNNLVAMVAPGFVTTDVFVAKFHGDGSHVWSKQFGDAANQSAASVAVDAQHNLAVVGALAGTIDFGGGALVSAGLNDVFIAKLDAGGGHLWSGRAGDAADQAASGVSFDPSGNAVTVGSFLGTLDFTNQGLQGGAGQDVFVAQLGVSNTFKWSHQAGNATNELARGVAANAAGETVVVGEFAGSIGFGPTSFPSKGGKDVFVAKLGPSGDVLWQAGYGDASDQVATAVAVDKMGVLVVGNFAGSVNFGGTDLASQGGTDLFVVRFDGGGNHTWSKRFGDAQNQSATAVAIDASGHTLVVGDFAGSINFGSGDLTSTGGTDIFIAKLGP